MDYQKSSIEQRDFEQRIKVLRLAIEYNKNTNNNQIEQVKDTYKKFFKILIKQEVID